MPSPALLLERCARIEGLIGAIYRRFAESTPCGEDTRALWRQMAQDEDDHASQLRLAQKLLREQTFDARVPAAVNLEQVEGRLLALWRAVQERPVPLADALRASSKLEQDFQRLHAAHSLSIPDEGVASLFRHLARADEEHGKTLGRLLQGC